YLMVTALVSLVIYPVLGHWAWHGVYSGNDEGWLQVRGFVDFAGSTAVHSVGGWVALAALLVIGPRAGRFVNGEVRTINPGNLPMAMLGGIILWFGWIGFNGGSSLQMNSSVAPIVMKTLLAAGAGLVVSLLVGWSLHRYPEATAPLNGSLAGLVAITAGCHAVSATEALLIGGVGGALVRPAEILLEKAKIDDAVGAIPVHLMAGIWGTLAVALFGDPRILATGLGFWEQLGVQTTGILCIGLSAFLITYLLLSGINRIFPLRVTVEEEKEGLNISEHRARTDLVDLFLVMDHQKKTGDLSFDVPVEPFTEVGQIAERYNEVLGRVRTIMEENEQSRRSIEEAFERIALEQNRAEKLLLNILPEPVAQELKSQKKVIAQSAREVTILFADIVGFTSLAETRQPHQIIEILNRVFSVFDRLTDVYRLEKIKTIGDAYMVVGGLPNYMQEHATSVARFALDIMKEVRKFRFRDGKRLELRVGMHTGPVVAGVIGEKKFIYDIWGDSVNVASRLESHSLPGKIHVSEQTARLLESDFELEERGTVELKGRGNLLTYFLNGERMQSDISSPLPA
ncbi:MAG: guanylate cyclase, partial [Leptospiraceae bacterium]|nr:guanylate cyclase [Leptospiraceae bacterium]